MNAFRLLAALTMLALAGCQSNGAGEVLDPTSIAAPAESAQPPVVAATDASIGNGAVRVGVLLPLSAPGTDGERARNIRDAVVLAAKDLGEGVLTVAIRDTGAVPGRSRELAVDEIGRRSVAIIGPSDVAGGYELNLIKGDRKPPFFILARKIGKAPGVYALPLGEVESAAAGAVAAVERGKRHVAILTADNNPAVADIETKVAAAVHAAGGIIEAKARYGTLSDKIAVAVKQIGEAEPRPDVIVIASGGRPVGMVVQALRDARLLGGATVIVGTSEWTQADFSSGVEGALIATIDSSEMAPMAERYRAAYGRGPDRDAALAYDAIALAAGLARQLGEEAFAKKVVTNPTGFRSTSGVFRFLPDGSTERLLRVHRVSGGTLRPLDKGPSAF